jgi:hypothetical protein
VAKSSNLEAKCSNPQARSSNLEAKFSNREAKSSIRQAKMSNPTAKYPIPQAKTSIAKRGLHTDLLREYERIQPRTPRCMTRQFGLKIRRNGARYFNKYQTMRYRLELAGRVPLLSIMTSRLRIPSSTNISACFLKVSSAMWRQNAFSKQRSRSTGRARPSFLMASTMKWRMNSR